MAVEPNSEASIEFLRQWMPDRPWLLSAIDPEKKQAPIFKSFEPAQANLALAFVKQWNGKRNMYFSVNLPKVAENKKANKKDIGWFVAVHVDVDPVDGQDIPAEQARILKTLQSYEPKPSIILFSGGGYQGFWLLREAVEVDDVKRLESYNRKVEHDLGGDHCFNIDRIMRLPGTINLPDAKKRAKGRTEALAHVVSATWDSVYELGDLKQYETPKAKPKGRAANDDENATTFPLPEWAQRVLEHGTDHEGKHSYDNDRSKAMWAVTCAMARANWSEKQITDALLDKDNKLSEHVHDQANPQTYAARQATKAKEEVGTDFIFNSKGQIATNQSNIRTAFAKLGVRLSYNDFSRKPMVTGPDEKPLRVIQDEDSDEVYLAIDEEFSFRPSKEYYKMVITNEALRNRYHPVRTYLDSLQWDGVERIDSWLVDLGGADDTPYVRAVGALMLLAGVRRIRQPGAKFDELLILVSAQGTNKSSALSCLAVNDEWFTDTMPLGAKDKEVIEMLSGKWVIEIAELKGLRNSGVEHLKAFTARQVDRARLSYGHFTSEVPRQCVMFATTNSDAFLKDPTGNRRFWPVEIKQFDLAKLRKLRDQLWAEAAYRESEGASIRLDESLWGAAAVEQNKRRQEEPYEDIIRTVIMDGYPTGRVRSMDVWTLLNISYDRRLPSQAERIAETMAHLGWVRGKVSFKGKTSNCYLRGDEEERSRCIFVKRDDYGLQVTYDEETLVDRGPEREPNGAAAPGDIPF